ncbi:hypothetical protein [Burkholderia gladioli]|uniref:hypothetical protein n=1 Tax=Burkholderia gladioli TaxID=28095 RepID=UPI00163F0C6A|nr:hypothetical protein [Burkholderia gladioli]
MSWLSNCVSGRSNKKVLLVMVDLRAWLAVAARIAIRPGNPTVAPSGAVSIVLVVAWGHPVSAQAV